MKLDHNEINQCQTTAFGITPNLKKYLFSAKKDRVDFVYNTAALEGNAMTYPEVQTLLEGITVGGHKLSDEQQILNQNRSVQLLFEMIEKGTFNLSKEVVCALHAEVAKEEVMSWGVFREGIKELEAVKNPVSKAIGYFLFGAKNQFFYDGNKRTSRLVMNGILLSCGYPMLNIKAKDKVEFNSKMIEFYESDSLCDTLRYLVAYYMKQNSHLIEE